MADHQDLACAARGLSVVLCPLTVWLQKTALSPTKWVKSLEICCFNLYWLVFAHFFSVLAYLFLVPVKSKNSVEICSPAAWSDRLVLTTGLPPFKKKNVSWKGESWKYKISVDQQIKIWNTSFEGSLSFQNKRETFTEDKLPKGSGPDLAHDSPRIFCIWTG